MEILDDEGPERLKSNLIHVGDDLVSKNTIVPAVLTRMSLNIVSKFDDTAIEIYDLIAAEKLKSTDLATFVGILTREPYVYSPLRQGY